KVIDKGFLSTGIRHFYFDKQKPLVWMASESGLIVFNTQTKKSQLYDAGNGLSNSYVYSILPENDTTLWVSTNKGINKVLVHHTANGLAGNLAFTPYTQVDGLQSNEFNTGAFYKSKEGELFFGGVNGINWFTGAHVITNHHKPSVVLTDLRINEKGYAAETAISYLNAITLPYDQNTIHLRFASLEFTNANANLYAYQLEGVDKEWIHNASLNEARYANLPPGNYRFKAVGTNSDGVWNETPLEFSIVITPPYWQTLWFKLLVLLTVIFVSGFVLRFYIRTRIRNKLRELEKQQAVNEERLRISRDMHDELGMGLTKIALLSEVTKQHFTKQTNDVAPLQEITATSRHLTEKMGEIIWTLNPKNDTLDNLGAYLKEHLSELSEMASLDLITVYPDQIPNVKVTNRQRQQILLVTKEGFHNIIRHANAKHVVFSMEVGEDVFFTLEDDGIGFEETPVFESPNGKGNGLHNMAWRMKQIGGSLKIHKRKGGGTVLQYRFALTP
ncbi:MAG TPA: triple tyrosine motif-containing protein, partial [Flavisolibacter sp.]